MIKFENVSFSFPDTPVLKDASFEMKDGEFVGILGPNGGGKSTFLRLCLSLLKPTKGKVTVKERRIAYVAQTTSISDSSFPATVYETVSLGLVGLKGLKGKERRARTEEILNRFGLMPLSKRLISELSGGQAQKVKIAKALISEPSLLVLDEPDAGMDENAHEFLIDTIDEVHKKRVSILFVSHHPHDLEKADKIYFIEDGMILTYEEEKERGHHHVDL